MCLYFICLLLFSAFESGESSLDECNKITATYYATRATLAQQEIQLNIEKTRLESYVGVKLDSFME